MDKWVVWCNLNIEQDTLQKHFGDKCVSIQGSTKSEDKIRLEREWREGNIPIMLTKPECFGYGLNWQVANNMIFVGLSDSYEQLYQAIRRCWRFGQTQDVNVYIITSEAEGAVKANIERKEKESASMINEMIQHTQKILTEEIHGSIRESIEYNPQIQMKLPKWI